MVNLYFICLFVALQGIAYEIKDEIDKFKEYVPLYRFLSSPAMKERHWDLLLAQTGN